MIRIYERTNIKSFTFGSVAADSTGGGEMDLLGTERDQKFHSGVLRGVAIACDSTNFNASIFTKANGVQDTINEIYRVEEVSKYRRDGGLFVGWVNDEEPLKGSLYLTLTNNDGANATGTISVDIHTDIPKRYSSNR